RSTRSATRARLWSRASSPSRSTSGSISSGCTASATSVWRSPPASRRSSTSASSGSGCAARSAASADAARSSPRRASSAPPCSWAGHSSPSCGRRAAGWPTACPEKPRWWASAWRSAARSPSSSTACSRSRGARTSKPRSRRSRGACAGDSVREAGSGGARFVWGALATLLAALSGAVVVLATNRWVGVRDLPAFVAGTLPLALLIGFLSTALGRQELKLPNNARYALGLALGGVFGFLWSVAVSLGAFPWFAELRVPVIPCWVGGGAAGLVSGLTMWPARGKVPELLLLCGFAVGVVACYEPVRAAFSGDQQVTVVFLRWWPDSTGTSAADARLSPGVQKALRTAGIQGHGEIGGRGVHGHGKPSLAVFVLRGPLAGRMTVAIPDRDTIVYEQRTSAFEMVPGNSPTLERTIDLYPDRHDSL